MNLPTTIPVFVNGEHLMDVPPQIGQSTMILLVRDPDRRPAVDSRGCVRTTKAYFEDGMYLCRDSGVRLAPRSQYEDELMLVAR